MTDIVKRLIDSQITVAARACDELDADVYDAIGDAVKEIERLRAELTEWREEPFGGLVRAGVLFMSPERVEEAKAQARRAGIEAAAKVCDERMHAYRAGTPTDETMAAIEEIADLLVAICELLEEKR